MEGVALARVYNGGIGGALNTEADRALTARVKAVFPDYSAAASANRTFHAGAIRHILKEEGIAQLVDLGCGMFLGEESTHQLARGVNPSARVVYVDTDPVVIAHLEHATAGDDQVGVVHADLCDVDAVLQHPATRAVLDLDRPVGVLATAVLHCLPDTETGTADTTTNPTTNTDAGGGGGSGTGWGAAGVSGGVTTVLGRYHEALAPGSMLALSHATADFQPVEVALAVAVFAEDGITIVPRTRQEIWDLLGPWRPTTDDLHTLRWPPDLPGTPGPTGKAMHCYAVIARSTR